MSATVNETANESAKSLIHDSSVWDVAIVGGGIAGCVSAIHLARRGLRVVVLEKESGPHHKVCGEFLSSEGIDLLEEVGVRFRDLGARPIRGFRLHGPMRTCETKLPLSAYGISRRVLDEELLRLAAAAGAEVRRGVLVREKNEDVNAELHGLNQLETSAGAVRAKRVIIATGKSEFRAVQNRTGRDSGLVGLKMHVQLKPSNRRMILEHCDLFIFENGYAGLLPIEGDHYNFCLLLERTALKSIGSDWDSVASYVARHCWQASQYLDGAKPLFKHFATIAKVPYGFLRRDRPEPGLFFVGDQMAVIPSLTGDGMSIAAMTGKAAAMAIAGVRRGQMRAPEFSLVYQREMRAHLRSQVAAAYHLHLLFKNPQIVDWATYAVNAFPKIVDLLFAKTRCSTLGGALPHPASKARVRRPKSATKRLEV